MNKVNIVIVLALVLGMGLLVYGFCVFANTPVPNKPIFYIEGIVTDIEVPRRTFNSHPQFMVTLEDGGYYVFYGKPFGLRIGQQQRIYYNKDSGWFKKVEVAPYRLVGGSSPLSRFNVA